MIRLRAALEIDPQPASREAQVESNLRAAALRRLQIIGQLALSRGSDDRSEADLGFDDARDVEAQERAHTDPVANAQGSLDPLCAVQLFGGGIFVTKGVVANECRDRGGEEG